RHTRLVSDWSSDVCSSDLDEMVEERAHVDLGEGVAELTEGACLMPRGDGHQVSLEEPERLNPGARNGRGKVLEVVAQGRRELPRSEERRVGKEGRSRWERE